MNDFKKQLQQLKNTQHYISPHQDWVSQNRQTLLSSLRGDAEFSSSAQTAPGMLQTFVLFLLGNMTQGVIRPVFVVLLVVTITVSSWIAGVNASYNSLPGETLYNVKLATEKFQIALGGNETKVKLNLEFASRRVEEASRVAKKDPQLAAGAIAHADKTVDSAKKEFSTAVQKKNPEQAVALAKDFSNKTQTIAENLDNVKLDTSQEGASLVKGVAETKKKVIETSLDAVAEVVKQVDEAEVKELVSQTVGSVLEGVGKTVEKTKGTVDELKELSATTTLSTLPLGAQSTTTVSSNTIAQVIAQAEQTSQQAWAVAGQVEVLIAQQNLLGAIEKTKEITVVTTESHQAVVDVNNKAKELGPAPEVLGTTVNANASSSPVTAPTQESKPVTATGTAKEISTTNN